MSGSLRRGSQGAAVRHVQQAFNLVLPALPPLVPDGIFGALTEGRTKDYQRMANGGLSQDGIVGPMTLGRLVRAERLSLRVTINRLAARDGAPPGPRPHTMQPPPFLTPRGGGLAFSGLRLGPTTAPPTPFLIPPLGGPAFTPFRTDPRDVQWMEEVRAWLAWMNAPPGNQPPPPVPSLLPPSGHVVPLPFLPNFPMPPLLPGLPTLPPPPILPNMPPNFPLLPTRQFTLPGNTAPRVFDGLPFGSSTEIRFQANGSFDPSNKKKPYKLKLEVSADIFRFNFLGSHGQVGVGPQVSFLDEHPFSAQATLDLKIFNWEPFKGGTLTPSLSLGLSSALTLPWLELEAAAKLKAGLVWRPRGALRGIEGFLGASLASKAQISADDQGSFLFKGMPVLPGLIFSISASDEKN